MIDITIRQEQEKDYRAVYELVKLAFSDMPKSDGTEHFLVDKLRVSDAFIPELSLVAELNGQLVGHILITKIQIENEHQSIESLTLAPVSVHPDVQRKGIGGALIKVAHEIAKSLDYQSVVLLGHANYYPRFGYEKTSKYGIKLPFPASEENCMIIELQPNALKDVSGIVKYPKAFFE